MKKLFYIVLVLVVFLTACGPVTTTPIPGGGQNPTIVITSIGQGIFRFIDNEANVVCWLYDGGGLSCLPINDTMLRNQ